MNIKKLLFVFVFLLFGLPVLFVMMGNYLVASDPIEPVTALIMLSGGTESRMAEVLRLYQKGIAEKVILTETGQVLWEVEGTEFTYSTDVRTQLINAGIPAGEILITKGVANSTKEEARAVRELMEYYAIKSGIVVTDPYHTRRTRIIFWDIFTYSGIHLGVHPVEDSWYKPSSWFVSAQGWKYTWLEYIKLFGYYLKDRT